MMIARMAGAVLVLMPAALPLGAQGGFGKACISEIKNQAGTPPCLEASSNPTLGRLFPISQEWFVSPIGKIGLGTTTPTDDVEVCNGTDGFNTVLGIKGNNPNVTGLRLSNTDPLGHTYFLGSWGSLAGAGSLQGKFSIFDATAGVHRLIIAAHGHVGIGASVYSPSTELEVAGTITGAAKNFRIDHPLDPANKLLVHACVESSEMMNVYRGNAQLDGFGEAVVEMPTWFDALNADFTYQLTAIGAPAPDIHVAEELMSGSFRIAGGSPGMKVSWLVTGVRRDAYALAHPLQVEQDKGTMRNTLLYPDEQRALLAPPR